MQTNNLKTVLNRIDRNLNNFKPNTMDELIDIVHATTGAGNYGTSFSIVQYMGYTQGVRVYVTGRSKTHVLPTKGKVYSVFNGLEKYIAGGYNIEHEKI